MVHPIAQAHLLQGPLRAFATLFRGHSGVDERQLDVMQRVGARQQVERLEDEADFLVADTRQLVVAQIAHLLAVQPVLAARRGIEAADQVHQGGFPRAGWAHARDEFILLDLDIDAAQCVYDFGAHLVLARQVMRQNHGIGRRRVARAERERLYAGHNVRPTTASTCARAMR